MKILIKTVWKMSESVPRKLEMQLIRRVPSRRCHITFFEMLNELENLRIRKVQLKLSGLCLRCDKHQQKFI